MPDVHVPAMHPLVGRVCVWRQVHGRVAAHTLPTPQYLVACQADRPFMHEWAGGKVRSGAGCTVCRSLCISEGGRGGGGARVVLRLKGAVLLVLHPFSEAKIARSGKV